MDNKYVKIHTTGCEAPPRVTPGHFTTNYTHINYYISMTTLKMRLSEAQEIAKSLMGMPPYGTVVGIIICLGGTQVIGSFLAQELTGAGAPSMNTHKTIYTVTPEYDSNSQMVLREDILPVIRGKDVILLTVSVTTGLVLSKGIESVLCYGGVLRGITAIFNTLDEINGHKIISIFNEKDVPKYAFCGYRDRPLCKQGRKLEALVNSYRYISL